MGLEEAHCCGCWVSPFQSLSCLLFLCITNCKRLGEGELLIAALPFHLTRSVMQSLTQSARWNPRITERRVAEETRSGL